MTWRTLFFQNKVFLRIENNSLYVKQEVDLRIPIEDIACIILESPQITLTSSVLSRAADCGIAIFTCGENHHPNGLLAPYLPNSRQTEILRSQIGWSQPFKKRCWQAVVKSKIRNQAKCLDLCERSGSKPLYAIANRVLSGDPENREAQAARRYFSSLFGKDFRRIRGSSDLVNSGLNYGYAILRGAIARSLCGSGFLLTLGLHHDSVQNAFNLADDLLEPLRPFCDQKVALKQWPENSDTSLGPSEKAELVALLGEDCVIGNEKQTLLSACGRISAALAIASRTGKVDGLVFPELPDFLISNESGDEALDEASGFL